MAVQSPLKPILLRIVDVIGEFVFDEGLGLSEVALAGSWNDRTERLSLVLSTARPLSKEESRRWYAEILEALRKSFAETDTPYVTWNIGLVIQYEFHRERTYLCFRSPEDEDDVSDLLESELHAVWKRRKAASI